MTGYLHIMNSKIFTGLLVIITLMIPCFQEKGMAIGEFALGLNAGLTYDPNNLENLTTRYNMAMKEYDAGTVPDESINQIQVPYSPVFGFNIRYQFNFFFFRIGSHYTTPLQTINGAITPDGGVKNKIKIETSQVSFPATIGLLVPLSTRTHFFIGGGISYNQADISITQSNPIQVGYDLSVTDPSLSNHKRDRYSAAFVGYHFMIGAEIPVHEKFTLSVEWVHQEGRSHPIDNDGTDNAEVAVETPKKTLDVRGDFLIFGLNYYISF